MKKVLKYEIEIEDCELRVPAKAKLLHVGSQVDDPDVITLWFEVNPDAEEVVRFFRVYGTGQPIQSFSKYCGTVIKADGALVWHVYELV